MAKYTGSVSTYDGSVSTCDILGGGSYACIEPRGIITNYVYENSAYENIPSLCTNIFINSNSYIPPKVMEQFKRLVLLQASLIF